MNQHGAVATEKVTDEELVRRVQQNDREAFGILVKRHERSVYWMIEAILHNPADSEEVLQESFVKALEHIADFRGDSRFATWLIRIAINEARMRLRKYRPSRYDSLDQEQDDQTEFHPRELSDWRPNPEEEFARDEIAGLLRRAIQSLPPIYREVFLLRDVQHLSTEEAAAALGITVPATKTRLLRARLMAREFLAPHFKSSYSAGEDHCMIRCTDVLREISDILDEEITPEMRAQLETHLCACRHCKVLVDTTRKTMTLVSSHYSLELPQGVSERLLERLAKHGGGSGSKEELDCDGPMMPVAAPAPSHCLRRKHLNQEAIHGRADPHFARQN